MINIAELLKDCPEGMELDCVLWDNVTFERVADGGIWVKHVDSESHKHSSYLYNDGSFPLPNLGSLRTKCVIFPKGKTTWEGFNRPFMNGDIVFYDDTVAIFKEWGDETLCRNYVIKYLDRDFSIIRDVPLFGKSIRREMRFATEEEKQQLFNAIKDNGYRWDEKTKTLEKLPKFEVGDKIRHKKNNTIIKTIGYIYDDGYALYGGQSLFFKEQDEWELVPNKFDITTLKPFDKVLVRGHYELEWKVDFFSHYTKGSTFPYNTIGNAYRCYCIPYKGNEYLLGTTKDCYDFYKTWEE